MSQTQKLSVIVPVFNAEATLPELYSRLTAVLGGIAGDYEIIFVEDCGKDGSWGIIQGLASRDPKVRGIKMSRNFGQHNALLCGIRAARFPVVVTLDDDLQNPPEEIPNLLIKLDEGFDVVYWTPIEEKHTLFRVFASKVTNLF